MVEKNTFRLLICTVRLLLRKCEQGFPGGSVAKNLPAVLETWFHPWSGKIPHAVKQLSRCTTTVEPVLWSPGTTITELMCNSYWSPSALELVLQQEKPKSTVGSSPGSNEDPAQPSINKQTLLKQKQRPHPKRKIPHKWSHAMHTVIHHAFLT